MPTCMKCGHFYIHANFCRKAGAQVTALDNPPTLNQAFAEIARLRTDVTALKRTTPADGVKTP